MIFFVGPLPPPVHGFSNINMQMLERLKAGAQVRVFNTSPNRQTDTFFSSGLHQLARLRWLLIFFGLCFIERPKSLYIGLSGGIAQLFDLMFLAIARLFKLNIHIHHHSFAYLNDAKIYNRLCFWMSRPCQHIVLCQQMADKLNEKYQIKPNQITVLSNSAFYTNQEVSISREIVVGKTLNLGFISNITEEKGIFEFLQVVQELREKNVLVNALIAGPLSPDIKHKFDYIIDTFSYISYLGPVYGKDKELFFKSVDLLLFPTKYQNEAEPVVIIEALRFGIPVLAVGRGCIFSMLDNSCGKVFASIDDFKSRAAEYIERLLKDEGKLSALSSNASARSKGLYFSNQNRLETLLSEILSNRKRSG